MKFQDNLFKQIPTVKFPCIDDYKISEVDEEIVDMGVYSQQNKADNIIIKPMYWKQGIPGSPKSVWVRKTVADKLLKVARKLKNYDVELQLCLYDGWRPWVVQNRLYQMYYTDIKLKNPDLTEEEIHKRTRFYVSQPSENPNKPFLHNTGGAIDLTIARNGIQLDMGTYFDDFSNKAWTNHFEEYTDDEEVRDNRRLLYNLMISEGFTNLPSEWWHYDYGNKFWSYFTGKDAIYKGKMHMQVRCFPLR